jgi:diguanylate cyclase (GGDEF)-like protein/PAS domain S-box-containing protein
MFRPLVPKRSDFLLGLAYFSAASLAVALTRYEGGVAFLWPAGSLLIAVLLVRPRREWPSALACCAVASMLATGLFGFGWRLALPLAGINLVEALVAARLFRQFSRARSPLGSPAWIVQFVLAAGFAGPLTGGVLLLPLMAAVGHDPIANASAFVAGHALGNLTFVPLLTLVVAGRLGSTLKLRTAAHRVETATLLGGVTITCLVVFAQSSLPLLFLPLLPIILATFRGGQGAAAASVVLLALVGCGLTLSGHGPVQLVAADTGTRMQFLQFYLASTVLTILPVAADLRKRARLHGELRASEERYRILADHSTDIIMHLSADGRIRFVSPSVRQLGGFDPESLIGSNAGDLILAEDRNHVAEQHQLAVAAGGRTRSFDYRAVTRSGEWRWFETHTRAIVDEDGRVDGVISIVRDISRRKAEEERLSTSASTDPLTGLPNRRAFRAAVQQVLDAGSAPVCLALIDIDHFKRVNDRYGYGAGDEVLQAFAVHAQRHVRAGDTIARIGGEEFAILLPGMDQDGAVEVCDRLRREIARTGAATRAGPVRFTISGGVTRLTPQGLDAALKRADDALYAAKNEGRDRMSLAA